MIRPVNLDKIFQAVLDGKSDPTAKDLLQAMIEDKAVLAAAENAMKIEIPDGAIGKSRAQHVRTAVLEVLEAN